MSHDARGTLSNYRVPINRCRRGGKAPPCTLFETPEYPEWIWTAMSQDAGNEMVTCVKNASYRVVLAVGADAGCHVRTFEIAIALLWTCSALAGTGAKYGTFLSSLTGLVPVSSGQPTVGNGGLFSVVPMGLLKGHSLPTGQSSSSKAAPHRQVVSRRHGTLRLAERRRYECQGAGQRTGCQARVLGSGELPNRRGHGVANRWFTWPLPAPYSRADSL